MPVIRVQVPRIFTLDKCESILPVGMQGSEDVSRLRLGMTFETAKSLVKYVKAYSSRVDKEIRVDLKRKGGTMRVLLCTDEMCPFKVVAYKSESASAGNKPWYISSLQTEHHHECTSKTRIPSRRTEYRRLRAAMARDPSGAARVFAPTAPCVAAQVSTEHMHAGTARDPSVPARVPAPPDPRVAAQIPTQQIRITRDATLVSAPANPRGVLEVLDCLSKSYAIRAQLRTAMGGDDENVRPDPFLQQSIELVEKGLRVLEQEYAVAIGIAYPDS